MLIWNVPAVDLSLKPIVYVWEIEKEREKGDMWNTIVLNQCG